MTTANRHRSFRRSPHSSPRRLSSIGEYALATRATSTLAIDGDCLPCKLRRDEEARAARAIQANDRVLAAEQAASLAAATDAASPAPVAGDTSAITWSGPITFEGVMTGDGRYIEPNALSWDTLPAPLRYVEVDTGGHDNAVVSGRILSITRKAGGVIWGEGDFDSESDSGMEAARKVARALQNGVSVDLDDVDFEIRVAQDLLQDESPLLEDPATGEHVEPQTDADGRITVLKISADDEVMVTNSARIRAATIVAIPAFEAARISLDGDSAQLFADAAPSTPSADAKPGDPGTVGKLPDGSDCSCIEGEDNYDPDCDCSGSDSAPADTPAPAPAKKGSPPPASSSSIAPVLLAGGYPVDPPGEWFNDPHFDAPTPLTVTDDGRVFGHLAVWGTCHAAYQGQCVTPPTSSSSYSWFRTGSLVTAEGAEIPVGHITLDTLHAGKSLDAADTLAHYEHTGKAVVDVAAGEDSYGIWLAGALRPGVTDEQVRALRASPLSGDWRRVGGSLELVAALAVNVPGFPVPRPQGLVASGVTTSLVASGMLPPAKVVRPGALGALSSDDLRYLKRLAERERREDEASRAGLLDRSAALARRVRAATLTARVSSLTSHSPAIPATRPHQH